MKTLILLRHGQSLWNLENRFTGWTDVDLTDAGREQACRAGELLLKAGILPQYCFSSYLKRAIHTLQTVLDTIDRAWLPVVKDWHLNERHYGALQGLDKAVTADKYSADQVQIWRRSYDVAPPPVTTDDDRYPGKDPRYATLTAEELPVGESLYDTVGRVRPCWEELIVPALWLHRCVVVSAHGNSLRALVMIIRNLSPEEIVKEEIPMSIPRVLTFDDRMQVISDRYL